MNSIFARFEQNLWALKEQDQFRFLSPFSGHDFCSNDYLALARHPNIIAAVKLSLDQQGYGSSSSRFIRGETADYLALENKLARFKGAEKALIFSSGYTANIGVLTSLIMKGDLVFSDRLNHASLIDGIRLSGGTTHIFPHLDVMHLRQALKNAPTGVQKFLVTESLFSMDGDVAPLDIYAELAEEFDVALIVDEAHAVGLYGNQGAGLIDHFGINDQVVVSINGLGKAFGCFGAFVSGRKSTIDYITQKARTLMYTTALPPCALHAIDASLSLVIEGDILRQTLFLNVMRLRELLRIKPMPSPIIPIIIGDNRRSLAMAQKLMEAGFEVKAIRPPTVENNSARLRITTNVTHSMDLLETFGKYLKNIL